MGLARLSAPFRSDAGDTPLVWPIQKQASNKGVMGKAGMLEFSRKASPVLQIRMATD